MMPNSASYEIWKKQKLGSLFSFHRSLSASRAQLGESGIPYLHYGDIHKTGKTNFDPEKDKLPKLDYRENAEKYLLNNGDVVFVDASEDRKDASRFCVIKNKNNVPFLAGLHTVIARPKSGELNVNFSEFLFQSNDFRKQVSILANGMKVFGVSKDILSNIVIRYPQNTAEQEKIAEILGTWDSAIEKLTALIAAKRLQKKGLMQKLLTAQIRLPGFTGEWQKVKLGDFLKFQTGFPFDSQFFNQDSDGIRLVKNRDLKSDDQVYFYSGKYANTDIVENGDILVGMDGDFLPCLWKKGMALLNQRVGKIVCKKTLNHSFAYYILFSPLEKIQNETASTTVKHLSHSGVEKASVTIPTDISEQKAIADVLSKADEEIDLLTRKLDLLQSQKKGLMQQLLTGKIRVKVA